MIHSRNYLLILFILTIFIIGCSSNQPISPDLTGSHDTPGDTLDSEPSSQQVFGLYNITVDTSKMEGTIEPVRSNMSNDTLEAVDITGFLSSTPCKDCLRIFGIGFDSDGDLTLDIGLKHPFDAPNLAEPPTGRNRADLHVFNIEGIVLSDLPDVHYFTANDLYLATGNLLNADGYTSYLDQFLDNIIPTDSQAHPYILHFDDYSNGNYDPSNPNGFTDLLNPSGNLVMKMGSDYSIKTYEFDVIPGEVLSFGLAVGATYGLTTSDFTERLNPEYLLPQHNKKAASEVHVEIVASNLERGDTSSVATMRVEVMDINHTAGTGAGRDKMLFQSNVASVSAYSPEMGSEVKLDNPVPISGDGRNSPLVFEITITNEDNAPIGDNPCLIKIVDAYPANMNPNPALMGADIMGRVDGSTNSLGFVTQLVTYQYVNLYVEPCDEPALRTGVVAKDIGLDADGHALVAYEDNQVWRYDTDYCSGSRLYTAGFDDVGKLLRIDAHSDGRSVVLGDGCGG